MTMVRLAPESTTVTISNSTLNVSGVVTLSTNNAALYANNARFNFANIASTVGGAFGLASINSTAKTKKIRVIGAFIMAGTSGNVYFGSDTGFTTANGIMGNSTAPIVLQAGAGFVLPIDPTGIGWFQTSVGTSNNGAHLSFIATTTGPWAGTVVWTSVS